MESRGWKYWHISQVIGLLVVVEIFRQMSFLVALAVAGGAIAVFALIAWGQQRWTTRKSTRAAPGSRVAGLVLAVAVGAGALSPDGQPVVAPAGPMPNLY